MLRDTTSRGLYVRFWPPHTSAARGTRGMYDGRNSSSRQLGSASGQRTRMALGTGGSMPAACMLLLVLAWDLPGSGAFAGGMPSACTRPVGSIRTSTAGRARAAAVFGACRKRVRQKITVSCSPPGGQEDGASGPDDDRGDTVSREAVIEKLEQARCVLVLAR